MNDLTLKLTKSRKFTSEIATSDFWVETLIRSISTNLIFSADK